MTNSTKALASAVAVVEAGNDICTSNREGESYILNRNTGEIIQLKKKAGTLVFEVEW